MAGVGGYQRPAKPAMVSGPGAMSQRTDGQPSVDNPKQAAQYISGMPYGEGGQLNQLAQAQPMAGKVEAASIPMPELPNVTPFGAPTERPNEPLTQGVPFGPGSNTPVIPQQPLVNPADTERAYALLGILAAAADRPDASEATRNMYRRLRGSL